MSDNDNMETIVALLGNLIDRIEKSEEMQTQSIKALFAMKNALEFLAKRQEKQLNAMIEEFKGINTNFERITLLYGANQRHVASEALSKSHHKDITGWVGSLSLQLTEIQKRVDQIARQKKGMFSR